MKTTSESKEKLLQVGFDLILDSSYRPKMSERFQQIILWLMVLALAVLAGCAVPCGRSKRVFCEIHLHSVAKRLPKWRVFWQPQRNLREIEMHLAKTVDDSQTVEFQVFLA
jgi:hypothetical protein